MKSQPPNEAFETEHKITALIRTLRAAEQELHVLTAGRLDFVASESGQPYLLRAAQEKLLHSEAAQRQLAETQLAILNALPAHIALIDSRGVIVSVNEAWGRRATANALQGPEFGIGENYLEVCERVQGDCAQQGGAAAGIRRVLNGEVKEFAIEYPCPSPVGQRWFRLMVTPLEEDMPGGAVVMHVNITDRKLAEETLRESEARYRLLFESNPQPMWVYDLDTLQFLAVNRSAIEHYGYAEEEFLRMTIADIRPTGDVPALREAVARTSDGINHSGVWRHRRKDGRLMMMEVSSHPLPFAGHRAQLALMLDVTERKQIEEALLKNEALLRIAGHAAHLGGWTLDLPGRKLFWSDEICAIHDLPPGYTPTLEEGIGYFLPEHRAEITRLVEACAANGTPYDVELPKLTAKGRKIWVRTVGEAVRDADGRIVRLQGAFQDITARKLAELELAHANRALRLISLCNEALIHASDEKQLLKDTCQLAVDTGGYRMAWVGYAQNDESRAIRPMAHAGEERGYLSQIQLSWSDYEPGGQGPAARAIRSGQATVCEDITQDSAGFTWQTAAVERGYRSVICLPLREKNDTFGLLALYSGEVNRPGADELKLLQELADDLAFGIVSLRNREQHRHTQQKIAQQAALLDQARDAILVRGLDHRITYWNKSAERLYGWSAAEAVGQSVQQLLHRNAAEFEKAMAHLLAHGEWSGELRQMTRHNRELTVEGRWTLLQDEAGKPQSVLAISTDVTEKKKLEAQFLRSQRMEGIGTLAGGIAHDLNNVLAPIMISVQMLKQDTRDAEALKLLDTLEICSRRGANLVKQVLSFARGVDGQRILIQPAQLVRELQHVLQEIFPKNIAFDFASARELWPVTGDPTQLHQVILNLCINARDAMPDGGSLKITMENTVLDETYAAMNPDSRAGAFVMVTVADTGTGIPPDALNKIFEPFFTTKELGKGTGLGLSTVLGIVKSHGGFITVASEPGQGSQFKVYLPASPAETTGKAAAAPPHLPRGHGEVVLVVDDEESIRKVVQKTLERFGYRVLLASNGAEAVSLYAEHQPEIALVLTDMMMPIMDGPALVTALKEMNPGVRIIASSGLATNEGVAKVMAAGVRHFVPKPYTTETMLKTIHQELTEPVGDAVKN